LANLLSLTNSVKSNFSANSENVVVANKKIADENTTVLSNSVKVDLTKGLNRINKNSIT
jgi:hypothetical protein